MDYSVAMLLRTLMLLAATAMVVLLAGCGGRQQQDGSNSQHGSDSHQQSEVARIDSAGECTGRGGTGQPQQSHGEVSNGKIAFERFTTSGNPPPDAALYLIDEDGTNETRLTSGAVPSWSPDGQKIAFVSIPRDGKPSDIYVLDADGTNKVRVADDPAAGHGPAWSPDGEQIAFVRNVHNATEGSETAQTAQDIYVIDEDGTDETHLTKSDSDPETGTGLGHPVWSPEGNKIAFSSSTWRDTNSDSPESAGASPASVAGMDGIYVIDMETADPCKLTSTVASFTWSPEGNKVAFSDNDAIYVINVDGTGRQELTGAGYSLAWSPEGNKIAFVKEAGLYVINPDGSGLRRLANTTGAGAAIAIWSPDGEKIAFPCPAAPGAVGTDLCVINADGTEWKRIASNLVQEDVAVGVSWGRD
jgi:Tol biopolymer transport system component